MKKLVCMAAALMCVAGMAAAEGYVPSKTAVDMNRFELVTEGLNDLVVRPVVNTEEMDEADKAVYEKEIENLKNANDPEAYFANVTDYQGNPVSLKDMLGAEKVSVHEMCLLTVENYNTSYGSLTMNMYFSTPYQKDEKVVVLVGLVTVNEDGAQNIQWVAYEGTGVEEGGLVVEFDAQTMEAVQNGTALLAVVSK